MEKPVLAEVSKDRRNNLNLIRFCAAVMVIYSHSYPLANGSVDPLGRITGMQMHFGSLAVCIFFFFAGFLINKSVHRAKGGIDFFKARCIRIFPCLFIVVCISAVILGPCVTNYDLSAYFTNGNTYKYLLNSVFVLVHKLPGVFESNIYGPTVNGALWTLPVEFLCYVVCYCTYKLGILEEKRLKFTIPVFAVAYIALYWLLGGKPIIQTALRPCGMFYMGMVYYTYRDRIRIELPYVLLSVAGLVLSAVLHVLEAGVFLFLPYVLIYVAFGTERKVSGFGGKHEISYGMYLCAFPIQQTVTMLMGGSMKPIMNFALSVLPAIVCGYILNLCVERKKS